MAISKTAIFFSLALLATATSATASSLPTINPFCGNAKDYVLCTQLAGGADTWAKAMTKTLLSVRDKVLDGKRIAYGVGPKLPASFRPQTKWSVGATCRMSYDRLLDNIDRCIGFVKSDPDGSLDVFLSANTFTECIDGLHEFDVSMPEAEEFDREVRKLSNVLLAVAQLKTKP